MHPPTLFAAAANAVGDSCSRASAASGEVDHTILASPSLTGSSANGPVGKKRCHAVLVGPPVETAMCEGRLLAEQVVVQ